MRGNRRVHNKILASMSFAMMNRRVQGIKPGLLLLNANAQ